MANTQKPVDIRIGAVKATIWQNETEAGPRHSVVFSRLYKSSDEWKTTSSFGRDDLLVLARWPIRPIPGSFSFSSSSPNRKRTEFQEAAGTDPRRPIFS